MEPSVILLQTCIFLFSILGLITAGYFFKRLAGIKNTAKDKPALQMERIAENEKFIPQAKPQYSFLGKTK